MHMGRIVGNRVLEMIFRAGCEEHLQVGEMLIVDDEGTDTRYLIGVMDIEYGADAEKENWMKKEAGEHIPVRTGDHRSKAIGNQAHHGLSPRGESGAGGHLEHVRGREAPHLHSALQGGIQKEQIPLLRQG